FEVPKVADGDDAVPRSGALGALGGEWLVRADEGAARGRGEFLKAYDFAAGHDVFKFHAGGFDGADVVFAEATKVFADDGVDFGFGFFGEATLEIREGDLAMACVEATGDGAAGSAETGDEFERERLDGGDHGFRKPVEESFHQRKQICRTQSL